MTETHTQVHLTLIQRLQRNKRWVIGSMLAFVVGAFIYQTFSTARFKVTMHTAIQNNNQSADDIIDEVKSRPLIQRTLDRLPLQVNYYHKGTFNNTEIYGDSLPVKLQFSNGIAVDSSGELTFRAFDTSIYEIKQQDTIIQYHFNEPVKYSFVSFRAVKGLAFSLHAEPVLLKFQDPANLAEQYGQNFKAKTFNDRTLELSIVTTTPQKGIAFLNKLVEIYNSTRQRGNINESASRNENDKRDQLERLKNQIAMRQLKIDHLQKLRKEPINDQPKAAIKQPDKEKRNVQLKTLEVIKPYTLHPVNQFVQIPYGDEVSDKDLRGMISKFNKIQLDKQHELQDSQANRYRINGFNNQLAGLKTSIAQKIDAVSDEMKGVSTIAIASEKSLDDSISKNNKQLKALQAEYTSIVQNTKGSYLAKTGNVDSPQLIIIANTGSDISNYPSALLVYLLAALMGLVFAVAILLLGYIEIPAGNLADLRKLQARIYELIHTKEID